MEYDISNVKLKVRPDQTSTAITNQVYEVEFNINTIIQPVIGTEISVVPKYVSIASIPRKSSFHDRYDVLGIVIYVERCCQVPRQTGQPLNGLDVVIVDHSHDEVMIITAWVELTTKECETLHSNARSFPVVGFTALRPSYQKGFSLSTTQSTLIILDPVGEKANALRDWGQENAELLAAKSRQVCEVRRQETSRLINTLEILLRKKVSILCTLRN
ncbi:uncharacterized protein LOC141626574 [Silene latifolia]|uniref:uncharacterized protein LOC141626574 n=1 Tax=Silene latifolia TaxID=37657 RepID=UPI003D77D660